MARRPRISAEVAIYGFVTGASSGVGEAFAGRLAADGCAKAFQVVFTQALAGELAGTGVQVQVCCPGLIDTEFHAQAGLDLSGIPFPVMQPDEVVGAALAGLDLGEVVCVPGLHDPAMVDTVNEAQRTLLLTAVSSGLAHRYVTGPGA